MDPIGAANDAPGIVQAVGEAEARRQVVAIAVVGNVAEPVDFRRRGDRPVTQPEVESEICIDLPIVAREKLHIPITESAVGVADRQAVGPWRSHQQIGYRTSSKISSEPKRSAMIIALETVDLPSQDLRSERQEMVASSVPHAGGVAEHVLRAVERKVVAGSDRLQEPAEQEERAERGLFRHDQRPDAVVPGAHIGRGGRGPSAAPSQPAAMAFRVCVGVLPADELKSLDILQRQVVAGRNAILVPGVVDDRPETVVIDVLGGVGVQRPGIVRPIRGGIRAQDRLHDGQRGRIASQRGPLVRRRNQHVPVDLAAQLALAAVQREACVFAQPRTEREPIVVGARRLNFPDLKERAGAEETIVVPPIKLAVDAGHAGRPQMKRLAGTPPKFLAKEILLGLKFLEDCCCRPHALVEFLEDVVVDQCQADIFIAPRLAGVSVDLA